MLGNSSALPTDAEVAAFVEEQLAGADLDGRSVCVLVPDATRDCALPPLLDPLHRALAGRVSRLTTVVALGTHAAMTEAELAKHVGHPAVNHAWWDPATFAEVGTIPAERIAELSEGRLREPAVVRINRAVVEHDVTLIVGPVFPHEVVGFSGGNKYLFPGVSGREFIDLSHWLGALITSAAIIGTRGTTPVRALIDEAAALLPGERLAFCAVTRTGAHGLHALAFGTPETAWAEAAEVAAETHVRYLDAPVQRVLSVIPTRYDDLWTGAKGFYKVEPVVSDGGQVVLYAPHITELARTHPQIAEIGYHGRDFFLQHWEKYRHYAWGDLAHSTHLRGASSWDPVHGEQPRVTVTLASGVPETVTRAAGLDYLDPAEVRLEEWAADAGTLFVPNAGEDLFRLRRT